jgi:hypothetical protein
MTKLYESAYERLVRGYAKANIAFDQSTRPYYSVGAFAFNLVKTSVDDSGLTRGFYVAPKGQTINFFSYKIGDDLGELANLPGWHATDAETNMATAARTNDEDFAVEGISATSVGVVADYGTNADVTVTDTISKEWSSAIVDGTNVIDDPGSNVLPPETSSPLVLRDFLFSVLGPKCSFREEWNRKQGDYIGTLDEFPEGGGKPYLLSNGQPSTFNYFRLPEGLQWLREGHAEDTLLNLICTLNRPALVICTMPLSFSGTTVGTDFIKGPPETLRAVFKVRLHGHALFTYSRNP